MAITQADKMLSSLLCSICFSVLALSRGTPSALHLHQERRYSLPQNRGFFTVGANLDVFARDGRDAAAPALPLAAQVASDSSAQGEHRSPRSAGKSAMPKVYGQANLNDSHNQMVVHWAGEKSNVIVALARDSTAATGPKTSSVYVSYNYGTTFIPVSANFQLSEAKAKNGSKQVISQFYHSPVDNRRYLFVDSTNNYLWSTFDFCKTVQGFSVPFRPTDLLLHPRRSNLLLGYDGSHPNKQLWKSDDFGETWVLIQEHVKTYF